MLVPQDRIWAPLVTPLDVILRLSQGVYEFTDDAECLLRIAPKRAPCHIRLADGTAVEAGEAIGDLHLWNEHLPRFPPGGPDLCWAKLMARRLRRSLNLLALYVSSAPPWRDVRVFRAKIAISDPRRLVRIRRAVARYGFEVRIPPRPVLHSAHRLGDSLLLLALTGAFNPAALGRRQFFCHRLELLITRQELLARCGDHPLIRARDGPPISPDRDALCYERRRAWLAGQSSVPASQAGCRWHEGAATHCST